VSVCVQAFPSLQGSVLFVCTQPVSGAHESSVHGLLSLQLSGGPPTHSPPVQVSPVVQASPSLQGFVFGRFTQPRAGSQSSSVQTLSSSQSSGGPPLHWPSAQVSSVVQALPSSQGAVLFV
jgi:hypothetical protein